MTHRQLDVLFDAVATGDPTPTVATPAMLTALYRLLGFDGRPVTPAGLAAATGQDVTAVERALHRLPNVEWDEQGAVVGFGGLTLRRTEHHLEIGGQARNAWCAWDTLFLPMALDAPVTVRSRCPSTARAVTLTVRPTGIVDRDPDSAVLSFVHPEAVDRTDPRASFCAAVHFFANPDAAERWCAEQHVEVLVLGLDDAFKMGRRMIQEHCGCSTAPSDTGPDR